jgi:hypothetical protein
MIEGRPKGPKSRFGNWSYRSALLTVYLMICSRWSMMPAFALFRFVLFGLLNRVKQMGNESKVVGKGTLELR